MRQLLIPTMAMLVLAGTANAQTAVGNDASTVRVDGNSTVRTFGDGTTTITRPANDAMDNTRLGTEVRSSTTANPRDSRANVGANANADVNVNTNTGRAYDPATGVTRTVTGTGGRVMDSVADTIKGPLDSGASVGTTTSGSVGN